MMRDEQIAEILAKESDEYRKLSEEHRSLDHKLTGFSERRWLNPDEEAEKKRLQKLKLLKKDRMAELIRQYKRAHTLN
jgi:uncharacterized protein YdcH (DUF465 family)